MQNAQRGPDLNDPEGFFSTPWEIVRIPGLTRGQKELALRRWRQVIEERGLCRAGDVALLKEIARAFDAIAAQHFSVLPEGDAALHRLKG